MSGQNKNLSVLANKKPSTDHVHNRRKVWLEYNTEVEVSHDPTKWKHTLKIDKGRIGKINRRVALIHGFNLHL